VRGSIGRSEGEGSVPATPRRRRTAEETRRLVIDAAVAWIEENGSANLKVVQVASMSGVSDVLIYRYFADRQGLLTAALVAMWEQHMAAPLEHARAVIEALPVGECTPELLASLIVDASTDMARKRRWARLQVLAASPEIPELAALIRESQARVAREHESVIELARARMPGRHAVPARVMRMLHESVLFGFVLEDMQEEPVSGEELRAFFVDLYTRMYEPGPS
jgi:AcrR family transcriptional regulator